MKHLILLVEDNELSRDMLSRRLTRRGFEMILAENGKEAIDIATHAQPDLILLDMSLPILSGWDAAKALKESHQTKNIPIIALTAHVMEEDIQKALKAGCDDFDTKPIDLDRLLQKIENFLSKGE